MDGGALGGQRRTRQCRMRQRPMRQRPVRQRIVTQCPVKSRSLRQASLRNQKRNLIFEIVPQTTPRNGFRPPRSHDVSPPSGHPPRGPAIPKTAFGGLEGSFKDAPQTPHPKRDPRGPARNHAHSVLLLRCARKLNISVEVSVHSFHYSCSSCFGRPNTFIYLLIGGGR